jgi:hypothetical protein
MITFRLTQENSTVGGFYRCAYGNRNCLGMNERGLAGKGRLVLATRLLASVSLGVTVPVPMARLQPRDPALRGTDKPHPCG